MRTLIAQEVTINRPTGVLVMIAQRVSGDVRPVLDWRGALAAGAAFAWCRCCSAGRAAEA